MTKQNETIYKKILRVQMNLQKAKLKKTGFNKFGGYKFYELDDILPRIMQLAEKEKLMLTFQFTEKEASLLIIDVETGDRFCSSVPMPELKPLNGGINLVQSLGAYQTYTKRYLCLNVFGISEKSVIDSDELYKAQKREERRNRVRPRQSQKQDGGL